MLTLSRIITPTLQFLHLYPYIPSALETARTDYENTRAGILKFAKQAEVSLAEADVAKTTENMLRTRLARLNVDIQRMIDEDRVHALRHVDTRRAYPPPYVQPPQPKAGHQYIRDGIMGATKP